MLQEAQQIKLNFYSKYNRVKEKQDIASLLALIDNTEQYIRHLEQLTLTLNLSREEERSDGRSEEGRRERRGRVGKSPARKVDEVGEEEKMMKFREMEEKLAKLEKLERKFHEHIARSDREYLKKRELKEQQRREREKYKSQHINVVEHRSETSQPNEQSSTDQQLFEHEYSKEQAGYDFDDYYADTPQVKISERVLVDGEENRRQLRELLQKQKIQQKYVESVDEDVDGRASSSIVIERMNIPKKEEEGKLLDRENGNVKSNKNYYEIQLSHSQSENVISQFRADVEEQHEDIHESREEEEGPTIIEDIQMEQPEQGQQMQEIQQEEEEEEHIYETQQIQESEGVYSQIDQMDRQAEGELKKITEEYSEAKEEIEDQVQAIQPINYHSQLNNKAELAESLIVPTLFHSQATPRRTLDEEKEVQSIAEESLDYHPLESPIHQIKEEDPPTLPQEPIKNATERKVSFKKLIASNKPNLVPRLAISTILNEQINEAFGEHRLNHHHFAHPTPTANDKLHESIVSETPSLKPSKMNFKKALMSKNSKSGSKDSKNQSTHRDTHKQEKNKLLLKSFFDQN